MTRSDYREKVERRESGILRAIHHKLCQEGMEIKMKSRTLIIGTILSLVLAIMIPEVAAAKGGKPSQDDPPEAAGLLYGDLVVVHRDGAGVPLTR